MILQATAGVSEIVDDPPSKNFVDCIFCCYIFFFLFPFCFLSIFIHFSLYFLFSFFIENFLLFKEKF